MRDPYTIIERPLITEKAVDLQHEGKYTFRVAKDANKIQIRQAIESIYSVQVESVNTLNVRGEIRRVGKGRPGRQPAWKKAYVTLVPGQKIELVEGV
ncbi:MAG TPA: 50S ribosomal protein L23 [Armatimonadota bacterium]|jgi:large subunit ribosomal protein L23